MLGHLGAICLKNLTKCKEDRKLEKELIRPLSLKALQQFSKSLYAKVWISRCIFLWLLNNILYTTTSLCGNINGQAEKASRKWNEALWLTTSTDNQMISSPSLLLLISNLEKKRSQELFMGVKKRQKMEGGRPSRSRLACLAFFVRHQVRNWKGW